MKRRLCFIIVGFVCLGVLYFQVNAETETLFENGVRNYKLSVMKRDSGDLEGEKDFLQKAYDIFKDQISANDHRPLIMAYVIFLRLRSLSIQESFFLQQAIEEYVKEEFDTQFPTIEKITIFSYNNTTGADKKLLFEELNNIADRNRQKAQSLVEEAKNFMREFNYPEAINKLEQSLTTWILPEASELSEKCKRLEDKSRQIREDYNSAIARKNYQGAIDILESQAVGVLSDDEITSKKENARTLWSMDLYEKAREYFNKRDLDMALKYVNESLEIKYSRNAEKLKSEIKKRHKKFALFFDYGNPRNFKINPMSYARTRNIPNVAEVKDENEIVANSFDKSSSFGAGFIYLFSRQSGIWFSVSSMKQDWKFNTGYYFYWRWLNGTSASSRNTMVHDAKSSLTLISLDYLAHLNVFSDLYINLYVGPTVYSSNADLYAGIGFGGVWWDQNHTILYPEWFPFIYHYNEGGFGFGGNIGGGLEYKFPPFSIFMEFQYYLLQNLKGDWQLVNQRYNGGFGYFYVSDPLSQLSNLPTYEVKVNFSTYKITLGARFYL